MSHTVEVLDARPAAASHDAVVTGRSEAVDVCRGLAAILVVLGHVIGGVRSASLTSEADAPWLIASYDWIYSFHMPAFFLLSGIFAVRSLRRHSLSGYTAEKLSTLLYPYLLWGFITWACHSLVGGYTNSVPDPRAPLKMLYNPTMGPWFLYVLLVLMLALGAWQRVRGRVIGFWVLSVGAYAVGATVPDSLPILAKLVCGFGIYFALGVLLNGRILHCADQMGAASLLALTVGGFTCQTLLVQAHLNTVWLAPVAALGGTAGLLAVSVLAARALPVAWFAQYGRHSLEIYLTAGLAAAAARILLWRGLGVTAPFPHLVIDTAAGMLFSLALIGTCQYLRIAWLFRFRFGESSARAVRSPLVSEVAGQRSAVGPAAG